MSEMAPDLALFDLYDTCTEGKRPPRSFTSQESSARERGPVSGRGKSGARFLTPFPQARGACV